MSRWSRFACALTLLLAARADAVSVALRWVSSPDEQAAGFRVYTRALTDASWRKPIDVGYPVVDADGSIGVVVDRIHRSVVVFAVTAYLADGTESDLSNQVSVCRLVTSRFKVKLVRGAYRLVARASFPGRDALGAASGATAELRRGDGSLLFTATVPGAGSPRNRGKSHLRYRGRGADGLKKLIVHARRGITDVKLAATLALRPSDLGEPGLSWHLFSPTSCAWSDELACGWTADGGLSCQSAAREATPALR